MQRPTHMHISFCVVRRCLRASRTPRSPRVDASECLTVSLTLSGLSETQSRWSDLAPNIACQDMGIRLWYLNWRTSAWPLRWRHKLAKCHSFPTPHSCHRNGPELFFQPLHVQENSIQDACFRQQHLTLHSFGPARSHLGRLWPVFCCQRIGGETYLSLATDWGCFGRSPRNPTLQAGTRCQQEDRCRHSASVRCVKALYKPGIWCKPPT